MKQNDLAWQDGEEERCLVPGTKVFGSRDSKIWEENYNDQCFKIIGPHKMVSN